MKTLEEKGKIILEAVKKVRAKHREIDEKLEQLVQVATYYSHGIDPEEIEYRGKRNENGKIVVIITLKDGSVNRIPVKELEP